MRSTKHNKNSVKNIPHRQKYPVSQKIVKVLSKYLFAAIFITHSCIQDRLAGLVVKASASGAEDPGLEPRL